MNSFSSGFPFSSSISSSWLFQVPSLSMLILCHYLPCICSFLINRILIRRRQSHSYKKELTLQEVLPGLHGPMSVNMVIVLPKLPCLHIHVNWKLLVPLPWLIFILYLHNFICILYHCMIIMCIMYTIVVIMSMMYICEHSFHVPQGICKVQPQ